MLKKLNFGCGSIVPEDWYNLDKDLSFEAPYIGTNGFDDGFFDIIVCHCSLQMNDWHELPNVLKELHRLLKPEGVIRISLPDIVYGFEQLSSRNIKHFPNSEPELHLRFCAWLTWYSTTKSLLTQEALKIMLRTAGFVAPEEVDFKESELSLESVALDTRLGECYFIEATK